MKGAVLVFGMATFIVSCTGADKAADELDLEVVREIEQLDSITEELEAQKQELIESEKKVDELIEDIK